MQDAASLHFLIAAKHSEIGDLVELTRTVDLMQAVSGLVHELQCERGLTNMMLASGGRLVADLRGHQLRATDAAWLAVEARLQRLDPQAAAQPPAGQGTRLYARLAQALQSQTAVPALREAVAQGRMDVPRSTRAYVRVVADWLDVVFEAADIATDADVSRLLVSLFHLMQAKEQTGQERAAGSALFAAGAASEDDRQRLRDRLDAQASSMAGFVQFAPEIVAAGWQAAQTDPAHQERQRLRRLLLQPTEHGALNPALSQAWFDACTACMNALKAVEDTLLGELRRRCVAKCAALEHELSGLFRLSGTPQARITPGQALAMLETEPVPAASAGDDQSAPGGAMTPQVMVLVQSQARRLQTISAELDAARQALQERKVVERAKGLLMSQAGLGEEEAHEALRRRAMAQGRRLGEVAADLLRRTN